MLKSLQAISSLESQVEIERAAFFTSEHRSWSLDGPASLNPVWEFPKIRGTLFWGPYRDPTIQGSILGSPIFGNSF